jgi:hypothetical protein
MVVLPFYYSYGKSFWIPILSWRHFSSRKQFYVSNIVLNKMVVENVQVLLSTFYICYFTQSIEYPSYKF